MTGHIRAMVGGGDFNESQFNGTWQAMRQPGSHLNRLSAALDLVGSADILDDSPLSIKVDGRTIGLENFTGLIGPRYDENRSGVPQCRPFAS
jgi:membrane carboxypeptidase/penicillin-binding protein